MWIAIALAVVTLAVFCPVTGFQFVDLDDTDYVTANPVVQAGLSAEGFKWALCSEVAGNWHPITMLTHILDCQLFGVTPWWPHLVNMVLHAANAVLLFSLFKRMTGALWRSAIVAALFALHPLRVESVAWVSERKDVLSALFWIVTAWAYLRYAEECRVGNAKCRMFYGVSLLLFALGLMCKPMLVTLPFTLLLLDFWPLGRMRAWTSAWRLAGEKIPFFVMSAAMCAVTFQAQKRTGGMPGLQALPLGNRLGNALVSYARYMEKMLCPRHLAGLYPMRLSPWPWWAVALAAVLLLGVTVAVLAQWRQRPYLAAGWCWYLGTLVPVIGLVQAGFQAMADRYTYIPMIGLFVMLAWGGWDLAGALRLGRFAPAATAAALAACAALTVHQEFYWKDAETFNKRMIDVTPDNYIAHNNLGVIYLNAYRPNEAMPHFMAAVEENPNYAEAHNNLGDILLRQKRYDEAIEQMRTAVRLRPNFIFVCNLATTLSEAASARQDRNTLEEAARVYEQAVQMNPGSSDAHLELGRAREAQGRAKEAVGEFEQAARLDASRAEVWTRLGFAYAKLHRMPAAEWALRRLIRLEPRNAIACCWLGDALAMQNKLAEAIQIYLAGLKLNPADSAAEFDLALALSRQGRRDEAADHCRRALRLNPNFAPAQKALREMESRAE